MAREESGDVAAAASLVRACHRAAILVHVNPDGDTIGSALALARGLEQIGLEAHVYSVDELRGNLAFLPGYGEVQRTLDLKAYDLLVFVDSGDVPRFGLDRLPSEAVVPATLNIDHHATNSRFADVSLVDPTAAATGEQIYDFLLYLGVAIGPDVATCLLTALVTDTRVFRTASTTPRTLAIAADLFSRGAPLAAIIEAVYYSRSPATLRIWGLALSRLRYEGNLAWTEISAEMLAQLGASPADGDGVIDLLSTLDGVLAVALFREGDGVVKVSLRSNNGVDVAAVAAQFGGGGHPRASGCTVPGRLDAVQRAVLSCLAERAAVN